MRQNRNIQGAFLDVAHTFKVKYEGVQPSPHSTETQDIATGRVIAPNDEPPSLPIVDISSYQQNVPSFHDSIIHDDHEAYVEKAEHERNTANFESNACYNSRMTITEIIDTISPIGTSTDFENSNKVENASLVLQNVIIKVFMKQIMLEILKFKMIEKE